ncbi:MAG: hypothetical protein K9K76_09735 [Halanaerobiales bacterium]|nr:hypothetical protein [Halanaerobiales bacterium]
MEFLRKLAIGIGWDLDTTKLSRADNLTDEVAQSADKAEKEMRQLGNEGEKTGSKLSRGFNTLNTSLRSGLGALEKYRYQLGAIGAAGAFSIFRLSKMAGDAQETVNKFNVVFGEVSLQTRQWAEEYSDAIGRSEYATMSWLNSFQDVLVPMGLARDEAAALSKEMVTLAADLGSFNNVATDRAAQAMQSALVGNHEAVRSLGIQLSETQLDLVAQKEGYQQNFRELDNLTKMQLRFQEMIRQSGDAVDDATRTALEYNNQQLKLKGNLRDTAIAMGNQYVPSLNKAFIATNDFLDSFQESEWLAPAARFGAITTGLAGLGAVIGTLSSLGILGTVITWGTGFALLGLALEDLWTYLEGGESATGNFLNYMKPFGDEVVELNDNLGDSFTGLGKMISGGFWNEDLFDEGKEQFIEGYEGLEEQLKDWWNSFSGWVEDKFNIQSILEDKFSFAEERPEWVPEELDWWGEEGMDIEPINFEKMKDDLSKNWNETWSELNENWNESIEPLLIKFKWPNIKDNIQEEWNEFKEWWDELEIGFDFEMPDFKGMIDEQLNKLPDWSKELLNIDSEVIEKESKNISNNNKTETNVNDNSVNVEKGAINIQGATDPEAVGKEVKKQFNSYIQMQAGEVGAN